MKLIPKDAQGFEKFVYLFAEIGAAAWILFVYLSAFGVFHNFYSEDCKAAGAGWKIPGLIFLALSVWQFRRLVIASVYPSVKQIVFFVVLLILSICSMAGFVFGAA